MSEPDKTLRENDRLGSFEEALTVAIAAIERKDAAIAELVATLKGVYADAQAQDKLFEWWGPMKLAIAKAES